VRIEAGSGYHATVTPDDCATCHQDHLGEAFDLVRLDERAFDHSALGFPLELGHAELGCRDCHEPSLVRDPVVMARKGGTESLARTFLGLPTDCAGCHESESPHGAQFAARGCADCHQVTLWSEPTAFDHRSAAFRLDGRHTDLACAACHGAGAAAWYTPLPFGACSDCHADPHRGAMSGACASCHGTEGWHAVTQGVMGESFDHSRTTFALRGAHFVANCAACHRTGRPPLGELVRIAYRLGTSSHTYPAPVAETCASCHVDRHATAASGGRWLGCASCHSEAVWSPSVFGAASHADSAYPLTGAHVTAPCVACHLSPRLGHERFSLALSRRTCVDCHAADDPHQERYGLIACESCHDTEDFREAAFDLVALPEGAGGCIGCHAPDDAHAGQFENRECSSCHASDTFAVTDFDHSATRFPLDGAHAAAACGSCHIRESSGPTSFVRYRPLGSECSDCHGAST